MTKKNVATSGIGPSNSYQNASFAERKESAQLTSYTTEQLREALKLSEYDDPRPFWDKWKTHATLVVKNAAADHLKHMEGMTGERKETWADKVQDIAQNSDAFTGALSFLEAALNCESFRWDADQHEAASQCLAEAKAALEAKPEGEKDVPFLPGDRSLAEDIKASHPAPEGYALVPIDERADDILLSLSLNRISVDEAKAAMIAAAKEKGGA